MKTIKMWTLLLMISKTIPTPPSSLAVDDSSKYKVHCPSSNVAICSRSPGISEESSIGSFDGPVDLQKVAPLSHPLSQKKE